MPKEKKEKYVPKATRVTVRKGGQTVIRDGKPLLEDKQGGSGEVKKNGKR